MVLVGVPVEYMAGWHGKRDDDHGGARPALRVFARLVRGILSVPRHKMAAYALGPGAPHP